MNILVNRQKRKRERGVSTKQTETNKIKNINQNFLESEIGHDTAGIH